MLVPILKDKRYILYISCLQRAKSIRMEGLFKCCFLWAGMLRLIYYLIYYVASNHLGIYIVYRVWSVFGFNRYIVYRIPRSGCLLALVGDWRTTLLRYSLNEASWLNSSASPSMTTLTASPSRYLLTICVVGMLKSGGMIGCL